MHNKLFAIAKNTFIETIRQPIYGVLLWIVAFWLGWFNPAFATLSLEGGKDIKILQDVGLASLLLYGLLASAFSATSVITREIESRSILTIVSKPVGRSEFLIGKFLGVSSALLIGFYFLSLVLFMTVRHGTMETVADKWDQPVVLLGVLSLAISLVAATFGNYVYGWHFPTALTVWVVPLSTLAFLIVLFFDKEWKPQPYWTDFGNLQVFYAVLLMFFAVLILTAFAVALATRFGQVLTLTFCAGVFLLGLLSDYYFGQASHRSPLYDVLAAVVPNLQFFWVGDALTQDLTITFAQVCRVAGYAGLYVLAVLSLGVALFETREIS